MNKFPLTVVGAEKLRAELQHLKSVERPAVIQAIAEARAQGDLSENAEYDAPRKSRLLEGVLPTSKASWRRRRSSTPPPRCGWPHRLRRNVELEDAESGDSVIYQIVGDDRADIKQRKISVSSPIARRADRQVCGRSVDVQAPGGLRQYEVLTCNTYNAAFLGRPRRTIAGTVDRGIWAIGYVARRCVCQPGASNAGVLAGSCLK